MLRPFERSIFYEATGDSKIQFTFIILTNQNTLNLSWHCLLSSSLSRG